MIYGEILDIVDTDRIKLKILKIQGKSARYNNGFFVMQQKNKLHF